MTHGLQPYPSYKNSTLPWLGPVPEHWEIRRNGRLFAPRNETGFGDLPILEVSLRTGVRVRDMDNGQRKQVMSDRDKYKRAAPGDVAYNMMRMWQGAVGVVPSDGLVSPAYVVARPYSETEPRYFVYLFRTDAYKSEIDAFSRGIVKDRNRLYWEDFKRMPACVPPLVEQRAISDYLDTNAAIVRRFIRNRRRLIEVLNEQKQAIINRAVTRGLDPNVPLKPSGIDWLGDIPAHWEVKPLKRWTSINKQVLPESTDPDYMFDYVDIGCVGTGRLTAPPSRIRFGDAPSRARRVLRRGDTILSTVRTYLRAVYFVATDVSDLVASTGFAVLSPEHGVFPEYLAITLQSDPFINRVTANSIGIAYPAIAETKLGTFHVAMPPTTTEQESIVQAVRSQTAELTAAIERAQREIDLIREYRTRMIADVVTGKLDVRHLAAGVDSVKQPTKHANIHFQRAVFAAEIVHRLHNEPTLGHVKFEKLIFLCEKWCGVETGSTYRRQAAGPYDNRALRSIDSQLKKQRWYEAQRGDKGYRYVPLEKAGGHSEYFNRYFKDVIARFDEIIDTFRPLDTQRCEIVATLYAAWEDLLALGDATDDQIIEQVLQHWHPSKQKIPEDRWRKALGWMREKGLTPKMEAICVRK